MLEHISNMPLFVTFKPKKLRRNKPSKPLTIPSRRELDSAAGGVKPMSASDERKLDEAIELANEFAQEQQRSPRSAELNPGGGGGDSAGDSQSSSPRSLKGMFSLKKRDKSPKPEKKTFTEEFLGGVTDVGEEVTPEAQEAYNMLVVRGSEKNRSGGKGRTVRGNNANIRVPQGIPGRGGMKATAEPDSPSAQDSNPLRRLRESSFIAPKPKPKPQTKPKPGKTDANGSSMIQTHLPFFDKLKEQEQEHNYPGPGGDGLGFKSQPQQASEGTETSLSGPAPPPRNPLRSSTINSRPRERKNPLDLSNYTAKKSSSSVLNSSSEDSAFNTESDASSSASGGGGAVDRAGYRLSNPLAQSYTSATKSNDNSKTSSFTTTKTDSILPPTLPKSLPPQFQSPQHQQFSVKSVKLSATELGLGDAADAFWTDESAGDFEEMMRRGGPRMLGREEGDMSDEVRLMKKVLSSHVSTEDSLYALEETGWDVHAAVKLLKLKQLLSATSSNKSPSTTDAEHAARCKAALIQHSWDVQRAADFLSPASPPLSPSSQLSPPSYNASTRGRESPELVHV